ncbi:anthranilate phosphoribosyltransferase [[Eubacterium] cellulosolvens]
MITESISKLIEGNNLTSTEAKEIMNEIMSGKATEAQIAALLTALRMKGETVDEITAFAFTMRKFCHQIHPKTKTMIVDTCGTGGDKIKTFNISTIAAIVAAGAGVTIAKHGNRSVTSHCGSADVLETLGFNLKMPPELVEKSIENIGIGFMFAPTFHPAMKYAIGPRREIKIRTVFNILGPLTNPANAKAQLLGVYDGHLTEPLANVLCNLGTEKALVVHGLDGLDEISTIGQTKITSLTNGEISTSNASPEDLGAQVIEKKGIEGSSPEECAETTFRLLKSNRDNENNPTLNMVIVNAAAAIYLGSNAETIKECIEPARESIRSGSAYKKLRSLIEFSQGDIAKLEEMEKNE